MTGPRGTGRSVLLGIGLGFALFLLEILEALVGLGGATAAVGLVPIAVGLTLAGPVGAALAGAIAVAGLAVTVGSAAAVAVTLRHVLPGFALGIVLARRLPLAPSLLLVSLTSGLGLAVVLGAYLPAGATPLAFLEQQVVGDLERVSGLLGARTDPRWVAESARLVASTMRIAGPAFLLLGLFLAALANYVVARLCLPRAGFRPFAQEALPDHFVWAVIAAGFMLVSQHAPLEAVGLNVLMVLTPLYAIQGLAILRHFFQKARVPRPLQGVSFGLFAVQPLLLVAVAGLGLSDLWADFRKIRRAPTPA